MATRIKILGKEVLTVKHGRLLPETEYSDIDDAVAQYLIKRGHASEVGKTSAKKSSKKKA